MNQIKKSTLNINTISEDIDEFLLEFGKNNYRKPIFKNKIIELPFLGKIDDERYTYIFLGPYHKFPTHLCKPKTIEDLSKLYSKESNVQKEIINYDKLWPQKQIYLGDYERFLILVHGATDSFPFDSSEIYGDLHLDRHQTTRSKIILAEISTKLIPITATSDELNSKYKKEAENLELQNEIEQNKQFFKYATQVMKYYHTPYLLKPVIVSDTRIAEYLLENIENNV